MRPDVFLSIDTIAIAGLLFESVITRSSDILLLLNSERAMELKALLSILAANAAL